MASIAKNKPTLTNITSASTAYCCVTAPFVCDWRIRRRSRNPAAQRRTACAVPSTLVGVSHVGLPRRARLEVVAVLRAAHTARAMTVGHSDERRLPVDALKRQQRADAAAPTAVALEHKAAHDGRDDYRHGRCPSLRRCDPVRPAAPLRCRRIRRPRSGSRVCAANPAPHACRRRPAPEASGCSPPSDKCCVTTPVRRRTGSAATG